MTNDLSTERHAMPSYDLVIKNATIVRPESDDVEVLDVAVKDGLFAAFEPDIDASSAAQVVDGTGKHLFPGVVDVHQHWGIYNPLSEDAGSESRASAQGGVTSGITYIRTGAYYMNTSGPYAEIFPKILEAAEGRAYIDYGFHVAPILSEHIDEIPDLIEAGVPSFKIFMFYGIHGLHGRSTDQGKFLMIPEDQSYDYAHFEFVMRGIEKARRDPRFAEYKDDISLSLHCETAEIMRAYTKLVEEEGTLTGLEAYSASRPPHSEGLAITIASYLAHETELPNINLLHLTSRKAIEAAMLMQQTFPHINFRREVTVGHLLADCHTANLGGKVNPPLRPREDVEALWDHLLAGHFSWVTSDHACCREETKFGDPKEDVFLAKSGFGGAEYLLAGMISEGRKRGLSYTEIARLVSRNPAQRFGMPNKGDLAVGFDADFCLVDDDTSYVVRADDSLSTQEYTPFEGFELTARVTDTFLRGAPIFADGDVVGEPTGRFVKRSGYAS
jgi:allantoinase